MTTQHKRGKDKGEGFDGAIANIMQPTSHMLTVEVSLTEDKFWEDLKESVIPDCDVFFFHYSQDIAY